MKFRVDLGTDDMALAGWLEINDPHLLERLKHCAVVPCLIKRTTDADFVVDHFDLIPRESVETRPLEELKD